MHSEWLKNCPQDAHRMGPGLLRMAQEDGPRIAKDASRMSKGLTQDAPRMAPGLLRMAEDGPRIAQDASRM